MVWKGKLLAQTLTLTGDLGVLTQWLCTCVKKTNHTKTNEGMKERRRVLIILLTHRIVQLSTCQMAGFCTVSLCVASREPGGQWSAQQGDEAACFR